MKDTDVGHPITRNSKICTVVPVVIDKFVVDFANGIDVTRDHLRVQDSRQGFFSRVYDGLTGQGGRRQANINARLVDAVEGSLHWLRELTEHLASTNRVVAADGLAIARIDAAVTRLSDGLALVAQYAATRRELESLEKTIEDRLDDLRAWVARVEAKEDANVDLQRVLAKWRAGDYDGLSTLGRCYAAFEELRWGAFGYYCRVHRADSAPLLETLVYEATAQMASEAGSSAKRRARTVEWLQAPAKPLADGTEALRYLATDYGANAPPLVTVATQHLPVERWPNEVPQISTSRRLAGQLADETFGA